MWDHMDGSAKEYNCESAVYLLYCLNWEFCIIIDSVVGATGHDKHVVDSLDARDKRMPKYAMKNLLNTELICDNPNFFMFT